MATESRHFCCVKFNPGKVLQDAEARAAEVKPLPVFKVGGKSVKAQSFKAESEQAESQPVASNQQPASSQLLELEAEQSRVRKQRSILSTEGVRLVQRVEARLRQELGADAAREFMDGNLPMPELAEHYKQVQKLTDQLKELWHRIQEVKSGKVQSFKAESDKAESVDLRAIQYDIRRLDDIIYKTRLKLQNSLGGVKAPRNSDRVNTWREKIALAELQRDELKRKLKEMRI